MLGGSLLAGPLVGGAGAEYPIVLDFLVIAGGGAGNPGGGGGGAGGYRNSFNSETSGRNSASESSLSINAGSYNVTVGAGGVAPAVSSNTDVLNNTAAFGNNSIFGSIVSLKGGAGGYYPQNATQDARLNGGSGGGTVFNPPTYGAGSGNAGQGFDGHPGDANGAYTYSGSGGGAGASGTNNGGIGGVGLTSSITGADVNRGGGGSAGGWSGITFGANAFGGGASRTSGTPNTGGGGGGGGSASGSQSALFAPGSGGSGIVILRFPQEAVCTVSAGLTSTETIVGTDKVVQITAGTGSVTFS